MKQSELVIGRFYRFGIKRKAVTGGGTGQGMPAQIDRYDGQLIDKRNNGVLIMQVDRWTWDRDMLDPDKRAVKVTDLVKIKVPQIIGLAPTQPADRVPNPAAPAAPMPSDVEWGDVSMFEGAPA